MNISATKHQGVFIKRKRNVSGANLCQTLVFGWLSEPDCTLDDLATMGRNFELDISASGLQQRFTQDAAMFLKKVLDDVVGTRVEVGAEQLKTMGVYDRFTGIYVEDSSVITLPSALHDVWQGVGGSEKASKSAVKLQVRWDLKQGGLDGPHVVDGTMHDNKAASEVAHEERKKNSLSLRDKGYWDLGRMKKEDETGLFWLYQMKNSTSIYVDGKKWRVSDYLQQTQQGQDDVETPILLGATHQIACRLLAKRIPLQLAEKRRRVAHRKAKKRGKTPSQATLDLCDWVLLVTNVPQEKLSFDEAVVFVRVRWQIELLFKLWKSHGKIDESRSTKPWQQLCELYAKLIGMVFQHWLLLACCWQFPDRSLVKAAKWVRRYCLTLARQLMDSAALEDEINHLISLLSRGSRVNRSQKQPRLFQLLQTLEGAAA